MNYCTGLHAGYQNIRSYHPEPVMKDTEIARVSWIKGVDSKCHHVSL